MKQVVSTLLIVVLLLASATPQSALSIKNIFSETHNMDLLENISMDIAGTWIITQLELEPRCPVCIGDFDPIGSCLKISEDRQFWLNNDKLQTLSIVHSSCFDHAQAGNFICTQLEKVTGGEERIEVYLRGEKNDKLELGVIISSKGLFLSTGEYFTNRGLYKAERATGVEGEETDPGTRH